MSELSTPQIKILDDGSSGIVMLGFNDSAGREQVVGFQYYWFFAGADGIAVKMKRAKRTTAQQQQLAKNELRRTRDVVSFEWIEPEQWPPSWDVRNDRLSLIHVNESEAGNESLN